jgi:hypothetical protein
VATRRKHRQIDTRKRIAAELSQILGVPIALHTLDRWSTRRRDPLPIHGIDMRVWAFSDELAAWWKRNDRYERMRTGANRRRRARTGEK